MATAAIQKLIDAARQHAAQLNTLSQSDASEHGARVTQADADRWQSLADAAETEAKGNIQ